jgi:hypothetical protein
MRKQNCKLLSKCGTYTMRWLTPAEAQTMVDRGQARIISRQPMAIRLATVAEASSSANSKAALSHGDAAILAGLKPGFVEKLDGARVADMSPSMIASLQRLSGWGLLPRNAALESYSE